MGESLQLSESALSSIDLKSAAIDESDFFSGFLPRGSAEDVFKNRGPELEAMMRSQLQFGFEIFEPEVLFASKAVRGNRPFSVLDISQRLLYAGLTSTLQTHLPPLNRSQESFDEFKSAPLEFSTTGFVVMADVAACYQFIDHGILETELLARTAETELSRCVTSLLSALAGRRFGLPQGRAGSHLLADVVLDIAERKLIREGVSVWRYSDDFRIHAQTRTEAFRSLEMLEDQLRLMGLVLSEEKTSVRSRAEYLSWAEEANKRISEVGEEVEIALTISTPYSDPEPPDIVDVSVEQASRLLSYWTEDVNERRYQFGPDAVINRQLVNYSLWILKALQAGDAIDDIKFILEHEPSFTPRLMDYLDAMIPEYEGSVTVVLDEIINSPDAFLNSWQKVWLLRPLKRLEALSTVQMSWVNEQVKSRSDIVAAEASHVLAIHRLIGIDQLVNMFNACTEASRPQLVTAVTIAVGDLKDKKLLSITRDRPLYRWIAEEALGV